MTALGQRVKGAAAATRRGLGRSARFVGVRLQRVGTAGSRYIKADGAEASGLARLVQLQFLVAAGDAAIAVSLAGTLFFTLPTDQARPQVAQFLLLTMAPFAIVAPFMGPFLDRFRYGRRWAIGIGLALRAFLCWLLASTVATGSRWLFPCALAALVASKAFTITRAAAVPRLLPETFTLVRANSRISLANVLGAAVGGGTAALIAQLGADWSLRYAFVIFAGAAVLSTLLSPRVDATEGERDIGPLLSLPGRPGAEDLPSDRVRRRFRSLAPDVLHGLRCVMGARLTTGFLTMFLAFLLRGETLSGLDSTLVLAIVVAAAGVGNSLGTVIGGLLKNVPPERIAVAALAADVVMATTAAIFYALPTVIALGLVAGLCAQLAKLSYDALVQREVPEDVRTSVFARSETVFQLAWVFGGALGISLPLIAPLGFGVVAGLLVGLLVWTLLTRHRRLRDRAAARVEPATQS